MTSMLFCKDKQMYSLKLAYFILLWDGQYAEQVIHQFKPINVVYLLSRLAENVTFYYWAKPLHLHYELWWAYIVVFTRFLFDLILFISALHRLEIGIKPFYSSYLN